MIILITGGCGFLGSNLARDALLRGDQLIIIDNLSRIGSELNLNWLKSQGQFRFECIDIRNAKDVHRVVKNYKPDAIFHLAAQVAMTISITDPRLDFEINAIGTMNLLEAVRISTPEAIVVYSSTNKVYGDLNQYKYEEKVMRYTCKEFPRGFDESLPLQFQSPYGCSKGSADQYMLDYSRIYGLKTVVFRHSSIYGGHQHSTVDQGWVGWFCKKALEIKMHPLTGPFDISGNGKQVRDLLYVNDAKRLYLAAIKHIEKAQGLAFNIGGGIDRSLSLLELFDLLEKFLDTKLTYNIKPMRVSDQKIFVADTRAAGLILEWEAETTIENGIRETLSSLGNF
jgi:CDP-paratose 2-epimerase